LCVIAIRSFYHRNHHPEPLLNKEGKKTSPRLLLQPPLSIVMERGKQGVRNPLLLSEEECPD